jgi:hypothetical protein
VSPAPVSPAPVSPAPVSPAPVSPAPVSPAPVSPAPVSLDCERISRIVKFYSVRERLVRPTLESGREPGLAPGL